MKTFFLTAAVWIVFASPVMADDKSEVDGYIREKLDAVMHLLQDKNLVKKERNVEILKIITDAFDFPLMAKLTLGKKHWTALSKEDRSRFTNLFVERLKASYMEKFGLYSDEEIVYSPPVQVRNKVHMLTELVSGTDKFSMHYKLYKTKRGWQVYDVALEGVSLITTYRSQFNEILQGGTIDDLFAKLEKQNLQ
ncbi:ABC transporter substrate-binding protein [Nitrospira defluvii]|nr:ABC transporter substrate-binding protein [Nitrospira defluvii]